MPELLLADPPEATARSAQITPEEAAAMMRAAMNLFALWKLSDAEARTLLGAPSPRTFARWKKNELGAISYDTASRLSHLMGIHKALRMLFKEPERAYAWLRKSNAAFGGQSALARMLAGELVDLAAVRAYLDAERGGW
ncbi:MAG: MbcA/ParS/Xre antitoxin family protein [Pseudomonadota bacterium]|nr:MbcA/ParS/Xre antitoxin family protein [Pseudomonadota bacterium]